MPTAGILVGDGWEMTDLYHPRHWLPSSSDDTSQILSGQKKKVKLMMRQSNIMQTREEWWCQSIPSARRHPATSSVVVTHCVNTRQPSPTHDMLCNVIHRSSLLKCNFWPQQGMWLQRGWTCDSNLHFLYCLHLQQCWFRLAHKPICVLSTTLWPHLCLSKPVWQVGA